MPISWQFYETPFGNLALFFQKLSASDPSFFQAQQNLIWIYGLNQVIGILEPIASSIIYSSSLFVIIIMGIALFSPLFIAAPVRSYQAYSHLGTPHQSFRSQKVYGITTVVGNTIIFFLKKNNMWF
jgi:hypothetical protein